MFELTEQQLTWEIVGKWTAKDTDLDYSIIVKHQPMTRMDTMIGSSFHPSGKPYRIHLMYFLKGYQLFIATLRSEEGAKDFESKSLIDLTACSLMTEPSIARQPPRFLSVHDRASYFGERFFFHSRSDDLPPYQAAFTLRFPERSSYYAWEEAMKFSNALKRRIHKSTQQGEQADAGNRRSAGA